MSRRTASRTVAWVSAAVLFSVVAAGCRNVLIDRVDGTIEQVVTPPAVSAVFPTSESTDIPINTEVISISFEKQINGATVNAGTFYIAVLNDDGTHGETVSGSRTISGDTITFSPNADLAYNTTYIVVATRGIEDEDGNPLSEEYTWTFTTGLAPDTTAPAGSVVTINGGDVWTTSRTVTLAIGATDDRGVAQMNIANANSFSDANWTTYDTEYEWTISDGEGEHTVYIKFQDGSGNQSGVISATIMLDTTQPTVDVFAVDGGRSATSNIEISLGVSAFDDAGSSGVMEYQVRLAGDDWPSSWTALTIEGDDGTALETGIALPDGTVSDDEVSYEARVRDLAGNVSPVTAASIIYDLSQPTLDTTLANPASGQTGVAYDASVVTIIFNEEMNLATITPDTFYVANSGGTPLNGGVFEYEFDSYDGVPFRQMRIVGLELNPNSDYFITVAGTVEDVAGNKMDSEETWFFQTGNATDTTAPGAAVIAYKSGTVITSPAVDDDLPVLPDGRFATSQAGVVLDINASDDYNSVYGINLWGEGTGLTVGGSPVTLNAFEDPVSGWIAYDDAVTWSFAGVDGVYNLWYRLQDSRGNKSPDPPEFFSVVRDSAAPTVTSVDLTNAREDGGSNVHLNDPDGLVDLLFAASDGEGSGLFRFRVSNDVGGGGGNFDDRTYDPNGPASGDPGYTASETTSESNAWRTWSPLLNGWAIDYGSEDLSEESKTLYFQFEDYLENRTSTSVQFYYDVTPPTIGTLNILETNGETTQTGTFSDNVTGFSALTVDDLTYQWEQVDGPGVISFIDTDPGPAVDTSENRRPTVSANVDGTYLLRVSVADPAGNSTTATVPFIWDSTDPDDMGTLVREGEFVNTDTPVISWGAANGADYYQVQIDDSDAGSAWDIDDTTTQTSYTPASGVLEEGPVTFRVTPFDTAGNSGAYSEITVFVDTIAPAIADDGQVFLEKAQFTATYSLVTGGTLDPAEVLENGSGVASYLWEQTSGPGTITFSAANAISTDISANAHGYYGIAFTVTDNAGNATTANFTLNWDIEPPNAPNVTGIDRTPKTQPTWSWSSGGGGGNGTFRYRLMNQGVKLYPSGTDYFSDGDTIWSPQEIAQTLVADPDGAAGTNTPYFYTLEVQERDAVGNWSNPGTHLIWVDGTYTAPPAVVAVGDLLRTSGSTTTNITWNWTSGTGQVDSTTTYRWRVNGGGWTTNDGAGGNNAATYGASTPDGTDLQFQIQVEEYYDTGSGFVWLGQTQNKYGYSTVRVDRQGPVAPTVSRVTSTPTNDTTPTWSWSSNAGSDGTGTFRFKLDSSDLSSGATTTTATVYTAPSQTDGNHTLYVQEQDALGNWGSVDDESITVDTTAPTLTSLTLNSGGYSTNSRTVSVSINAASEPGMEMSILDYEPASVWEAWQPYDASFTTVVPAGEGTKRVYVRLRDSVGNISGYVSDTIILDQTAPTSASVVLNQGDFYTPSVQAKMGLAASDNYTSQNNLEVQYYYYDGTGYQGTFGTGSWEPFSSTISTKAGGYLGGSNFAFTNNPGYKSVYVRFRDEAGNVSGFTADSIYLQVAEPTYAWKGFYAFGATRVYYNPVTEPTGSNTTRYYTYYSTNKNADPNNGDPVTYLGNTTSTEYDYVSGLPQGELLYFWTRAYNADSGGFGPYSSTNVMGFGSRVTVIYDDDDPTDVQRALDIKAWVEDAGNIEGLFYVLGSWSGYSVTLLPEDDIPNSYAEANKIYGDPIITTPSTFFTTSTSYDGRVRNIASTLRPTINMGLSGGYFLYRVDQMWSSWGLTGTRPSAIDSGNMAGLGSRATANTRPASTSSSIWYSPLAHSQLDSNQSGIFETTIFTSNVYRRGVYIPGGVNPTDGQIYAGDPNYSSHFPVVRQGRYLNYGFYELPYAFGPTFLTLPARMGRTFFINLVYRMSLY